MPSPSPSAPGPRRWGSAPDAVERLYVYWVVSTVLLVLVLLVVIILTRGMLHRQTQVLASLEQRVAALEVAQQQTEALAGQPVEQLPVRPGPPTVTPPVRVEVPPAAVTQPAAQAPVPAADLLEAQLTELLSAAEQGVVLDASAADELLDMVMRHGAAADWQPAIWTRLATLARLREQDALAEALAQRGLAAGPEFVRYLEVSIRGLLQRGVAEDALRLARQLHEQTNGSAVARLLLAAALTSSHQPAAADELLENLTDVSELGVADRLLLARLLLHLERGRRLDEVLNQIVEVPAELTAEHSFLTAVAMTGAGRTVEALAILDWLAGLPEPQVTTEGSVSGGWLVPRPTAYEIHVWRGVTLMFAQQVEAARQALNYAVALDQRQPEATYFLGVLEARCGRRQMAESHLRNTLTGTPGYPPACEALALLEMEDGRISLALEHLRQALSVNPRRAGAYFLLGVAYARIGQAEPAADALRQAFHLDPVYLEEARHTEALLRLFTVTELEGLAAEPVESAAEPVESEAEPGEQEAGT